MAINQAHHAIIDTPRFSTTASIRFAACGVATGSFWPGSRWRVPLAAKTAAEAQEEFRKLMLERTENRLRHIGLSPSFGEFYNKSYLPMLNASGKKPATIVTEKGHYKRWVAAIGHLRLDKIRPSHISGGAQQTSH